MLIKRLGHCDVRLEVKNFASSVPTKDVDKFERDLLATNAHGILCSLGSKIVQHGDVDMSQLPNGRLAFYLANVGEDVDVVVTFLHVIYKLDAVTGADRATAVVPGLKLPESTVCHALDLLKGHVEKTRAMKANLGECLRLLGEMNLDALVTILGGGTATKQPAEQLVDPPPAQSRALLSAPASVGSIVTSMEGAVTMSAPGTVRNAATTNAGAGTVTSSVTIPGEAGSVVNKPFFFFTATRVCVECNRTFGSSWHLNRHSSNMHKSANA